MYIPLTSTVYLVRSEHIAPNSTPTTIPPKLEAKNLAIAIAYIPPVISSPASMKQLIPSIVWYNTTVTASVKNKVSENSQTNRQTNIRAYCTDH